MTMRQLLRAAALYGVADVLVLAVGGFLLLPLYTRTLSLSEFGTYVIIRANAEIFGYVLYFGLPSAITRIYFDYKDKGQQLEYLSSMLGFFALNVLIAGVVLSLWGTDLWRLLSPSTPAEPYIWFCFAIAAFGFPAALASLWLRLDERTGTFVLTQIISVAVLVLAAYVNLVLLKLGLTGLLLALLIGSVPPTAVLLYRLGAGFRVVVRRAHVVESLAFAAPYVVRYLSYFILNRFSILILQRYVAVDQVAIFGLATQLATLITVVATAFGKALQPAVFGAEAELAPAALDRASRLFIILMFCITSLFLLFASELLSLVAPRSYASSFEILLILIVASFVYSLNLISSTALEYRKKPIKSASAPIVGAVISVLLGLVLIPRYHLLGGALAVSGAYLVTMIASQWLASREIGRSYFGPIALALGAATLVGCLAAWLHQLGLGTLPAIGLKLLIATLIVGAVAAPYIPKGFFQICIQLLASLRAK